MTTATIVLFVVAALLLGLGGLAIGFALARAKKGLGALGLAMFCIGVGAMGAISAGLQIG